MGVQDLLLTLRKKVPQAFKTFPLGLPSESHKDCIVSIDGFIYITRYSRVYGPTNWVSPFLSLLSELKQMKVDPIVVLDTPEGRPVEKAVADVKRKQAKDASQEKLETLTRGIQIIEQADSSVPLSPQNEATVMKVWGILLRSRKYGSTIADMGMIDPVTQRGVASRKIRVLPPHPGLVMLRNAVPMLTELKDSAERAVTPLSREVILEFGDVLRKMGIYVLNARHCEGEALCTKLQQSKVCEIVMSDDSDVLPYGATRVWRLVQDKTIEEINLNVVLEGMGMTYDKFVDFCILCGTDFNNRIKGVGPVKALKLLDKHGSLDGISDFMQSNGGNIDDLNYHRVREIFRHGADDQSLSGVERDMECTRCRSTECIASSLEAFSRKHGVYLSDHTLEKVMGILLPGREVHIRSNGYTLPIDKV